MKLEVGDRLKWNRHSLAPSANSVDEIVSIDNATNTVQLKEIDTGEPYHQVDPLHIFTWSKEWVIHHIKNGEFIHIPKTMISFNKDLSKILE